MGVDELPLREIFSLAHWHAETCHLPKQGPSEAARCASVEDQQAPSLMRKLGVAGLVGAVGDLLAEAGFFKTDFSFFDFGGKAAGLESLLGLFDGGLGAAHVDIFGLFGDLGHDRDFCRRDFCVSPENRHVVGQIPDAIAKLTDA